MDNINTDELNEHISIIENDWILLKEFTRQVKDTEAVQLPKTQKDSTNQVDLKMQISNNIIEVIHEHIDSDNTSNDVSVITESDTDNPYESIFPTRPDNKIHVCESANTVNRIDRHSMYRSKDMVDQIILQNYQLEYNTKIQVLNMVTCFLLGCIIGIFSGFFLTVDDTNLYRNRFKDLQTECHSIIDIFKEINTTLNDIKAHILIENKLKKNRDWQFLESMNYYNKNDKSTREFFNNDPYIVDTLQVSLNVLSLLSNGIYNNNNMLKSNKKNSEEIKEKKRKEKSEEINKTLDIVNNTKILYETLISFNNSTQNMSSVPATAQFSQNAISKIHHTSHSLLTDLVNKINNVMLNVHYKYIKVKEKLIEKLCHLKNGLPDNNEFLKQLTMRNQLLNNYYKYCHLKNTSKKLNDKTNRKQNTKTNNIKGQTKKTDDSILHTTFENKDTETIDTVTYCNDKVNDCSQPIKIAGQCIDETLNNSFDETINKQNIKATSDYGKITVDKIKVNGSKANNHFKSNGFIKKASNIDKPIGKKNISSQNKMRNHVPKSDKGYYKRSFKNDPTEQDHHQTKSADWLFKRSNEREKLRQASNMHFSKIHKTSEPQVKIDARIRDMMRIFEQNINKTMRLFEQKIEEVLEKYISSKKK